MRRQRRGGDMPNAECRMPTEHSVNNPETSKLCQASYTKSEDYEMKIDRERNTKIKSKSRTTTQK